MKYILSYSEIEEIELELTGTCNLSCPLCTRNYLHANHQKIKNIRSLDEIINQLNLFPNLKHINIAGTVSEPTLYPEILNLLKYLVDRNLEIDFYSNASILNLQLWEDIGKLFQDKSKRLIFTICGSNNELHSFYRKGSELDTVLENARAFRKFSKQDECQYIIFEYNKEDSTSTKTKEIMQEFNTSYFIGSEGKRLINKYNNSFSDSIQPIKDRAKIIETIFKLGENKFDTNKKCSIDCISYNQKRIYIDQFGKVYACYSQAEFYEASYKEFQEENNFNYTNIKNFKYKDCLKCEKLSKEIIESNKLGFIF